MKLPKIAHCKKCDKKPKEEIWAMSYGDSGDQLHLQHWCSAENKKIFFPELRNHPFTANYVNGQRFLVRQAWNEANP